MESVTVRDLRNKGGLAELSVGTHAALSESERAARQAHLQQAESDFDVLPFDSNAARAFGEVAASLRTQDVSRRHAPTTP